MVKQVTDKTLEDTGERMIPAYHRTNMVFGEHIVRYEAAVPLVKGKTVLDIASGSGYGTDLLSTNAKKVYGVDVSKEAIAYATKNYGSSKATFTLGDATAIPLADDSVDVVVSFETLEHIEDYEKFMTEISRVLRPDGLLILSTPNEIEFPESNHFHIHEFEEDELEKLVKKHFKHTKKYFQGTWLYNALVEPKMLSETWRDAIDTMQTAPIPSSKSIYFYMLCSNRKLTESVTPVAAISEHWSERRKQEYEGSVRKHIEDQGAVMKHQVNEIASRDARIAELEKQLQTTQKRFAHLYDKVAGRLRNITKRPK
jgi:ubiquinone/menaquinone biosynthesis C-methylase UbiE